MSGDYQKKTLSEPQANYRKKLGRRGEKAALHFLQRHGYQILEHSYRCKVGEIDIVAREGTELVFVEVKTRCSLSFGLPVESISRQKRKKLTQLALSYLGHHKLDNIPCRFDVVGILLEKDKIVEIRLIRDAFPAET